MAIRSHKSAWLLLALSSSIAAGVIIHSKTLNGAKVRRKVRGIASSLSVSVLKGEGVCAELLPLLVLVSSHYQNSRYWLRIAAILASQGYDCHCIDLLPGATEPLLASLRSYVQQLSPQLATQASGERKRVVLLGHGLGGTIAQLYVKSGAPMSGLILAAPAGCEEEGESS